MQEKKTRTSALYRFGLLFVGLMALYYVMVLFPFFDRMLYGYLRLNAQVASTCLNLLGYHTHVAETSIRSGDFGITVRRGCDAVEPFWFFCAAVIATPIIGRKKIPGILLGGIVILGLNLVRIISLYVIGLCWSGFFSVAHLEIWPVVFILVALALWVGWIIWAKRNLEIVSHVRS